MGFFNQPTEESLWSKQLLFWLEFDSRYRSGSFFKAGSIENFAMGCEREEVGQPGCPMRVTFAQSAKEGPYSCVRAVVLTHEAIYLCGLG